MKKLLTSVFTQNLTSILKKKTENPTTAGNIKNVFLKHINVYF